MNYLWGRITEIFGGKIERILLAIIIIFSFGMMIYSSAGDSLIFDELAHIPAGYGYARYFDYRLNVEHPPLVKAISAVPLLFLKLNFPLNAESWNKADEWGTGSRFIFQSKNNADKVIFWARIGPIIITLFLIFFTFTIASSLMGERWALLPAFFVGISPNVLAHGHYVTTDIGVSLGILVALYYFLKYLKNPSLKFLAISGLTFGLAQLMKFSALILIPIFIILAGIYALIKRQWVGVVKKLLAVFSIGFLLVYGVYLVFSVNYPAQDQIKNTEATLGFSDSQRAKTNFESCSKENIGMEMRTRCFLKEEFLKMSGNEIARPLTRYLMGVWLVSKQSIAAHHSTFLNGSLCDCGRWYYFPELAGLKEPLPGIIFLLAGLFLTVYAIIRGIRKEGVNYFENNLIEIGFLLFICVYGLYSVRSGLNIGIRHIFPIMPLAYILAARGIKSIKISRSKILIGCLIVWYSLEVLIVAPYFISYFNELGGGVWRGYNYAVDSNYDWGQDLKRLSLWADENKADKILLSYFGAGDFRYYLGKKSDLWNPAVGDPGSKNYSWFAVSAHLLKQYPENYLWLRKGEPDYRAGTSIFIYKLH